MASGLLGDPAYAVGTDPLSAFVDGGAVNRLPTGQQTGSAALSLAFATRGQYVYDTFGNKSGSGDVTQLATIALTMRLNSSIVRGLGHRFYEVAKVTDGFEKEQRTRVDEALSDIVGRKLMNVISVAIVPGNGAPAATRIVAIDNSTQQPIDLSV